MSAACGGMIRKAQGEGIVRRFIATLHIGSYVHRLF